MSAMKIVKTIFLKAPPEHVWRFLTEGDKLALWFHAGRGNLEEGGDYILETNSYGKEGEKLIWGKVLESNAPHRLVHSFTHQWLDSVETICTWTLENVAGGTVLTLTHEGWDNVADGAFDLAADHDTGWDEHFARLRKVVS